MENIVLIGLMGAGKSTVGKNLASRIGWTFVDTDQLVEKRCGTTISVIFEVEGEKGFRNREQKIIEEVMNKKNKSLPLVGEHQFNYKIEICSAKDLSYICSQSLYRSGRGLRQTTPDQS